MNPARHDMIRSRLEQALAPVRLEIHDDSHLHAGHAGAAGGGGHFRVHVVSARFAGMRSVARHQLVYRSVADLMPEQIHALSITAQTPEEALQPN